jgi:polar amino acid transport system permease protein
MIREFAGADIVYLIEAARWTLLLALIATVGGGLLGIVVAVLRVIPFRPLNWLAIAWINLIQGTPLLGQLFVFFFGLPLVGLSVDAWTAAAISLSLYASAFFGEIWRGSLQSVPQRQWEAGAALGLTYAQRLGYVVLPQAIRISIAPTVGFLVQLVKATAVASIIGFVELTRSGQLMTSATFQPMIVYPIVAGLYFALCWPLSVWSQYLEKKLRVENIIGRKLEKANEQV